MNTEERDEISDELKKAAEKLSRKITDGSVQREFIPDEGICLIYAAEYARSLSDIAAISVMPDGKKSSEDALFNAGNVNRSITLTAMRFDPDIRSAAILRYSEKIVEKAREMLFEVREADRRNAGTSSPLMDWRTAFCCKKDDVPDIIFISDKMTEDTADSGKTLVNCEPIVILFGTEPSSIVNNILMLGERINNRN